VSRERRARNERKLESIQARVEDRTLKVDHWEGKANVQKLKSVTL
jgi:hypothetical protein